MSKFGEHIRARCDLCNWSGFVSELLDFDGDLNAKAEYCPACQSPYVVYNAFKLVFGEENEENEMDTDRFSPD